MLPRSSPILLLALLAASLPARSESWPEFRGPTGQGISTEKNLPVRWSRTHNVTWRQPVPGKGWSSPIVHEGRVYMTTAVGDRRGGNGNQSLRVLSVDAKSGKLLWNVEVFQQKPQRIHRKNSHASPTPVTDGRHLYVHFGTNGTACLDLDGKVIWRNRELRYQPVHGSGGSPALAGPVLIVSCDGGDVQFIVALDRMTGKIRWKMDRSIRSLRGFSFTTPLVIDVGGKKQIVSPASGGVYGYDPLDGTEIWKVRYQGGYSVVPRPVYGHGLVFVCTGFDTPSLLAIRPGGRGDVTKSHIAWRTRRGVPLNPVPLLVEDELYLVSDQGVASCLDARTGRSHWQHRLRGQFSASPVYGDGKIYFQSEAGEGIVIRPARKYRELSRNSLKERSLASYAISDGAIFIRTVRHLHRIDAGG